jgi:N-acetylglucosamine kinase-like BadF-type ATPase
MNRLFLGIEGGSTKTEGVLIDDVGKVYATLLTGPSNPWVIEIIHLKYLIEIFQRYSDLIM